MLAIRLQRVGRKGHAMYRLAIQEAQRHPSSGRVIAYVGTYDPHTKDAKIQVELAQKYLDNGAQPSPRVVKLLETAGVKLPKWVKKFEADKTKSIRHSDKLRKNQPKEEVAQVEVEKEESSEKVVEETTEIEKSADIVSDKEVETSPQE